MTTTFLVPKNNANSKLATAITAVATSLTVLAGEGARFPSTYPFHITIDNEILKVTNRSSDTFTVTRAQEGTAAGSHKASANVMLNITAKALVDLNTAVNTLETAPPAHKASHQNGGADEINVAGLSGELADPQTPVDHHTSHANGGSDEISVEGLSGLLADAQTPLAHKTRHQDGGNDEISVQGLSGLLADAQTPLAHKTSHQSGGADSIKLDDLAASDDNTDLNVSTTKHGLCPKLDNDAAHALLGTGAYGHPAGATHASSHQSGGGDAIKLDDLAAPDDNTDLNSSTTKHGLTPKLPNDSAKFLNGVGSWSVPSGGGGGALIASGSYTGDNTANRAIAHGLGVTPKAVYIIAAGYHFHVIHAGRAYVHKIDYTFTERSVTAMGTTNFYVGNSGSYEEAANLTGTTYYWVAIA